MKPPLPGPERRRANINRSPIHPSLKLVRHGLKIRGDFWVKNPAVVHGDGKAREGTYHEKTGPAPDLISGLEGPTAPRPQSWAVAGERHGGAWSRPLEKWGWGSVRVSPSPPRLKHRPRNGPVSHRTENGERPAEFRLSHHIRGAGGTCGVRRVLGCSYARHLLLKRFKPHGRASPERTSARNHGGGSGDVLGDVKMGLFGTFQAFKSVRTFAMIPGIGKTCHLFPLGGAPPVEFDSLLRRNAPARWMSKVLYSFKFGISRAFSA
ncbi:hypothetical protein GWK47_017033 [Chionoecetes opilio]|uniref:Uncharacterized protein n=1 Tax=Chionoecetes opilio TaxID=41210 RepID=A0A8J4XRG3_CHIOP|nr:hypothetical protein GWK47_017033 [Chionoecetes opilio]